MPGFWFFHIHFIYELIKHLTILIDFLDLNFGHMSPSLLLGIVFHDQYTRFPAILLLLSSLTILYTIVTMSLSHFLCSLMHLILIAKISVTT